MKNLLLIILLISTQSLFAQSDCDIKTVKNPITNVNIDAITINANMGKCILYKRDTTISLVYKTSGFNSVMLATTIDVHIDLKKAELILDNVLFTDAYITGYGTSQNKQVLKPMIQSPTFEVTLTKQMIEAFNKSQTIRFKLFGELGTEGYTVFSKRETKKVIAALKCLE